MLNVYRFSNAKRLTVIYSTDNLLATDNNTERDGQAEKKSERE